MNLNAIMDAAFNASDEFEYPAGIEETDYRKIDHSIYVMTFRDGLLASSNDQHPYVAELRTEDAAKLYDMTFDNGGDPYFETLTRTPLLDRLTTVLAGSCIIDALVEYEDDGLANIDTYGVNVTLSFEREDDMILFRTML